jgi:hypothetical protein
MGVDTPATKRPKRRYGHDAQLIHNLYHMRKNNSFEALQDDSMQISLMLVPFFV